MLKFIRSIFGSAPQEPVALSSHAIPGWIDEREKQVHAALDADTQNPMAAIRDAAANLQRIVNTLRNAEQDPETHPKIKSIAKNSLPLFLKSMNTALAKELPGEPETFYTAAVDCVKGCLNTLRGQGRYLVVAFPDEMKATKAGVDAIGHEINRLTKTLGQYKREMARIESARQAYAAVIDTAGDLDHSVGKEERARARISEISDNLKKIDEETTRLKNDPSLEALKGDEAAYAELVKQRDDVLRLYVSGTMTASHVLRKAEKIASRKHLTKEIHILNDAMDVLSDHEVADAATLVSVITASCPVTGKMISDGDLLLKNKDERMVFSDTNQFCQELGDLCTKYHEVAALCQKTETKIASHPVTSRLNTLEREKVQLESMHSREEETLQELIEWRRKTETGIPEQKILLEKALGEVTGQPVSVTWENRTSPVPE
jgi:myosin heavy subunit